MEIVQLQWSRDRKLHLRFLPGRATRNTAPSGKVAAEYGLAQSAVRLRPTCRHCDNYEFVIYPMIPSAKLCLKRPIEGVRLSIAKPAGPLVHSKISSPFEPIDLVRPSSQRPASNHAGKQLGATSTTNTGCTIPKTIRMSSNIPR